MYVRLKLKSCPLQILAQSVFGRMCLASHGYRTGALTEVSRSDVVFLS